MSGSYRNFRLVFANLLLPVATLVFAAGFFRYKPLVPVPDLEPSSYEHFTGQAPFEKVVFLVVDALRSDFVYSSTSGFRFTQKLIRSGDAVPFTAHAGPPSLTITRIKAMTEGSNPSFVDMFLNLADDEAANSLSVQDSWLARLKASRRGQKMIFYGENTWLQLFPDVFDRYEGVHAFYVPDFVQVDSNITRHISGELRNEDWAAFVMHFPGLDHVGHVGGPRSRYMIPKQREMDDIIRRIFTAIESQPHLQNTLFVVAGDHGMNSKGNHGGSSPGETSAALLFISPHLKKLGRGRPCPTKPHTGSFGFYTLVDQSDVVATLAGLLGFPLPKYSLGIFIRNFLPLLGGPLQHLQYLQTNAAQLINIFRSQNPPSANCNSTTHNTRLDCLWDDFQATKDTTGSGAEDIIDQLYEICTRAQNIMGVPDGNLSLSLLVWGIGLAVTAALLSMPSRFFLFNYRTMPGDIAFILVNAAYATAMFMSRVVEEEHRFWYYIAPLWLGYIGLRSALKTEELLMPLAPFFLQLFAQTWNPLNDGTSVHRNIRPVLLWLVIATTYVTTSILLSKRILNAEGIKKPSWAVACGLGLGSTAFLFKLASTAEHSPELLSFAPLAIQESLLRLDTVNIARALLVILASTRFYVRLLSGKKMKQQDSLAALFEITGLYLMTQSRAINVPMFLLFTVQLDLILLATKLSPIECSITSLVLAHTSFYSLGGSNSIASIDIPLGYNGIKVWSSVGVPFQVIVTNWAGPIWWSCASLLLLFASMRSEEHGATKRTKPTMTPKAPVPHGELSGPAMDPSTPKISLNGKAVVLPSEPESYQELQSRGREMYFDHLASISAFRAVSLAALMTACLRLHLKQDPALWIAMAPAYAFAGVWTVFLHPLLNAVACTMVWQEVD